MRRFLENTFLKARPLLNSAADLLIRRSSFNRAGSMSFAESILYTETKYYKNISDIERSGFKVYSQFDEDGILQFIISKIHNPKKSFIEFGVQDYLESNTRYLHLKDNWEGLIIDGDKKAMEYIHRDIRLRDNLKAVNAFITAENINELFESNGFGGNREIGIFSIDIDGNDYWVWKAINCINPQIIICEYNPAFGYKRQITVPYKADFVVNTKTATSRAYSGASLAAFEGLAKNWNKSGGGYSLVYANGNNAFFVRNDLSSPFKIITSSEITREYNFWKTEHLIPFSKKPLYDIEARKTICVGKLVRDIRCSLV